MGGSKWLICNTRPESHSVEFGLKLQAACPNAVVVNCPTSKCFALEAPSMDGNEDLVIFTSPLSVQFGLQWVLSSGCSGDLTAIGSQTMRVLKSHAPCGVRFLNCFLDCGGSESWWRWFQKLPNFRRYRRIALIQGVGGSEWLFNYLSVAGFLVKRYFFYKHFEYVDPPLNCVDSLLNNRLWVLMSGRALRVVLLWFQKHEFFYNLGKNRAICMSERIRKDAAPFFFDAKTTQNTSEFNIINSVKSFVNSN